MFLAFFREAGGPKAVISYAPTMLQGVGLDISDSIIATAPLGSFCVLRLGIPCVWQKKTSVQFDHGPKSDRRSVGAVKLAGVIVCFFAIDSCGRRPSFV